MLTCPLVFTVEYLGSPDYGAIVSGYIGSLMLAGAYLAITCLTSSFTRNQVISFILSVTICLILILAGWPPVTDFVRGFAPSMVEFVTSFSVMSHFEGFQKGVIDSRDMLFFVSVIAFSLFGTSLMLRSLRA